MTADDTVAGFIALPGELAVQVFKQNTIGHRLYAAYGFKPVQESRFEPSGDTMLTLAFSAGERPA